MKYTEAIEKCLKERGIEKEDPKLRDWQQVFAQVEDPRRKQGQRFTLTSILLLALAAILSNHVSELAIAEWGAGQSDEVKKSLGFEKGLTPNQSTLNRLFRKLSVEELEAAFRGIFLQIFAHTSGERGERALAIDGKVQKGRLKFEEEDTYPIHAVSIIDHETGIVLTESRMLRKEMQNRRTSQKQKKRRANKRKKNPRANKRRKKPGAKKQTRKRGSPKARKVGKKGKVRKMSKKRRSRRANWQ